MTHIPSPTTPGPLDLEHFLPYRLSVLTNRISQGLAGLYAERFGISITQWRVIAVLGREPGLSANDVTGRTAMDKVAVSRTVTGLLQRGLLERQVHALDRRRSVLQLSAEGARIYTQIVPLALDYEHHLQAVLAPDERAQLDHLLHKLGQQFDASTPRKIPEYADNSRP